MGDFLLRNIDDGIMERLKQRAQLKGHSLQQEIGNVLRDATRPGPDEIKSMFAEFDALGGKIPADVDIVELIREERDERGWK